MRKLVKLILLCLIAYPIISIVSSCSEEEDCSMNARPMMQCYLYKIDGETERVVNDTLDSLTITAYHYAIRQTPPYWYSIIAKTLRLKKIRLSSARRIRLISFQWIAAIR